MKVAESTFLRIDHDYTGGPSTTILRSLTRIFQNLKALDVGRENVAQRRQVSIDTVDNHQGIISTRQ